MSRRALERIQPYLKPGNSEKAAPKRKLPSLRRKVQDSSSESSEAEPEEIVNQGNIEEQFDEPIGVELPAENFVNQDINMALSPEQVGDLLDQHVGDHLVELEDLVHDYEADSLTKVELTEFSTRLSEIRDKLKAVRLGYRSYSIGL